MYIFNRVFVVRGWTGYIAVIKWMDTSISSILGLGDPITVDCSSEFATKEEAMAYGKWWAEKVNVGFYGFTTDSYEEIIGGNDDE